MGKNLTSQKRGKGSGVYRAPSFRYVGKVAYSPYSEEEKNNQVTGKVKDLVHSSGHYAPIAKIDFDGKEVLQIAPYRMRVGDSINCGPKAEVKDGNVLPLRTIPEGTLIFNIESLPGDGGKFARTSGCFARVLTRTKDEINVLLPSKKEHSFNPNCRATIGTIAGSGRPDKPLLKAGIAVKKWGAKRKLYPKTSALSMNAVSHPFGGSSSAHKGRPTIARKHAPAGAKVGMIRPSRSGRGKRK